MAFYRDSVNKISLIDRIVQLLTTAPSGATSAYWAQVQSGTYAQEGYVLFSAGSSGKDTIYVRLTSVSSGIVMSMIEKYTPNPVSGLVGAVENESYKQVVQCSSGAYSDTAPVLYTLSFDRDKIMLVIKGNAVSNANFRQTLAWIGLPERMSPKDDSTAVVFAVSREAVSLVNVTNNNTSASQCKVLRSRNMDAQSTMLMVTIGSFKTKGWNDTLLLSHIYLEDDIGTEGVRSLMTGIHPINQVASSPDFRDGDEITVGSKRYIVLQVWESGSLINCFPQGMMAIEKL